MCALMMGLSLTSCLSSGETTSYDGALTVYVYENIYSGKPYFMDALGNRYIPTAASWSNINAQLSSASIELTDYKMATIWFNYVVEEEDASTPSTASTTATGQQYDIELAGITTLFDTAPVMYVQSAENLKDYETAPVLSLGDYVNSSYLAIAPSQYDEKTIATTTGFWLANDKDKLNMHQLRVIYVKDELTADSKDFVLYVCHNRGTDEEAEAYYGNAYCFDVQNALNDFRTVTGKDPEKIILKAKEISLNTSNPTIDLPENYTDHEIEYKTLEDLYPSAFENK